MDFRRNIGISPGQIVQETTTTTGINSVANGVSQATAAGIPAARDAFENTTALGTIGEEISAIKGEVILVGHSLGASMLLKYLSEHKVHNQIVGLFLISTPFWSGDEKWKEGLKLRDEGIAKPKLCNAVLNFLELLCDGLIRRSISPVKRG